MALFFPVQPFSSLSAVNNRDAGKAAGDFGGAVGGVVVDDDQFPVAAELEDVFGLRDKRFEAGARFCSSLRAGMMTVSSMSGSGSG